MVPTEGSLVDLGESEASTLVRVVDVKEVVVEVVVGIVASGGPVYTGSRSPRGFGSHLFGLIKIEERVCICAKKKTEK